MGLASSSLGFLSWRRRITESDFTFHVFIIIWIRHWRCEFGFIILLLTCLGHVFLQFDVSFYCTP